MSDFRTNASMLEMYMLETSNLIENLEGIIIESEKNNSFSEDAVNEIFRLMHTIKGSSAMMMYNNIASLSHSIEDLFYYIREGNVKEIDFSTLSDLVLEGIDFIKVELQKIKENDEPDGDEKQLIDSISNYLLELKKNTNATAEIKRPIPKRKQQYYIAPDIKETGECNYFSVSLYFQQDCQMENIRAFTVVTNLKALCNQIVFYPENIIEEDETAKQIREKGFLVYLMTGKSKEDIIDFFNHVPFIKDITISEMPEEEVKELFCKEPRKNLVVEQKEIIVPTITPCEEKKSQTNKKSSNIQSFISVSVEKLDQLMDLVGEMVIAESMVTQNPELQHLELKHFHKAARHLHKITNELQDTVMSIRMVPLSGTFVKMHRIIRDMSKKLSKDVDLILKGEETEVDKNIIEHISDPLMHLIRNAIDHGIEDKKTRLEQGKTEKGTIVLEAKNSGSDVWISIKDDGKGLNQRDIYQKAVEKKLVTKKWEELEEKDIFNLILLPGFSTKESVTEFSGRGVGMDVVAKNIQSVGGSITVHSKEHKGTTIILKIPLTLAIIDGMNVKVGEARYTIPTIAIKEAFRPSIKQCIKDPDNQEMVMLRGSCYPILRLHEYYHVPTDITNFQQGILVMVQQEEKVMAIFVDELLGQQQVVVKSLPSYIKRKKNIKGLTGCTLLGDGSISLILDISQLIK